MHAAQGQPSIPNLEDDEVNRAVALLCLGALLLGVLALWPHAAVCAESTEDASSNLSIHKERNWSVIIPLWIPGYRGQFAIGDIEVDGESPGGPGFLERLLEHNMKLNFFFMGAFSYEWERWRIHGDVFGGKFTDDVVFKQTDETIVSASLRPFIPRLHCGYRLLNHSWGDSGNQSVRGWLYAGVRYYDVKAEVEVARGVESVKASWADPIVGAWIPVDLSSRWWIALSGDLGGFNVGSKLSWTLYFGVTYRVSALLSFTLAYNFLDVDYEGTAGSHDFFWRARVAGPGLGIRFEF